jgi:drug/metabolite transporter (DMT)-like permease
MISVNLQKQQLHNMIQRIQSVFLLLCAAILGCNFAFPFASSSNKSQLYFEDGIFNLFDNSILLTAISVGIVLILAIVFLYKNRSLQMTLSYIGFFLLAGLTGYIGAHLYKSSDVSLQIGSFIPIVSLIFLGLAYRYIKKDDKLVKSMDRLR